MFYLFSFLPLFNKTKKNESNLIHTLIITTMENYIITYRATLKTLLERDKVFEMLNREYPKLKQLSIEMDDKQFVLRMQSPERIESAIQNSILNFGHRVSFVSAKHAIDQAAVNISA